MVKRELNVQCISYYWMIWENEGVSWGSLARKPKISRMQILWDNQQVCKTCDIIFFLMISKQWQTVNMQKIRL